MSSKTTKSIYMSNTFGHNMRHRISITIDGDTLCRVRDSLRTKTYRNKSHFFEIAAHKLLGDEQIIQGEVR